MTVTITIGASTYTPLVVEIEPFSRDPRTIVHQLLATTDVAVTRRPASARTGTMRAVFPTATDANTFEAALLGTTPAEYADTELTSSNMTFVPVEVLDTQPAPSRIRWLVEFNYQEITA